MSEPKRTEEEYKTLVEAEIVLLNLETAGQLPPFYINFGDGYKLYHSWKAAHRGIQAAFRK